MAGETLLKVDNVETFYGNIRALDHVSVEVNKGEIACLIGANGAGKSTLMMTICGSPQARSGSVYAMVSGSVTADVRFWDLRRSTSVHAMQAHRGHMTALAVHDFAPLVATGTRRQLARLYTNSGDPITEIRYHDGFLGQRIGPVSTVAFHPHRLMMAVGALDSIVSVHQGTPPSDTY